MINLRTLLPNFTIELPDIDITGLKLDSRQVAGGDAFLALPGYQTDGRDYIDQAITAGACVIIAEADHEEVYWQHGVAVITVNGLRKQLSQLADRFYHSPSRQLKLIGVTGTNGKTSVTHILAQLLQQLGEKSGVIGTTGSGLIGQLLPEQHTTPDAVAVQQRLASLVAEGATAVAMEVSSHALNQGRVEALKFAVTAATNLSRDHLDYHGTMAAYAEAKRRLFTDFGPAKQVLNRDDKAFAEWLVELPEATTFGLTNVSSVSTDPGNQLTAEAIKYRDHGTEFQLQVAGESYLVRSPLLGEFNVYNLLTALSCLAALDYNMAAATRAVAKLLPVPGRMETFTDADWPLAVVDYAHTPDALQQVLTALRRHCRGELWCVFGCGGDRDRGKRPQMGAVAAELADRIVVTDDNPRTEAPEHIVNDILTGMPQRDNVTVIMGREQAVRDTLARAQPDDVVLFAGKGHEDYQVIGRTRHPYNERDLVAQIIKLPRTQVVGEQA